ncbi:MAG: folylpolyglutamate synthase/dihydrofolate synthase family protein [Planctomycetota bacterium]
MSSSTDLAPDRARQKAALRFLNGRIDYERARVIPYSVRDFKLDRMRELLARLGDPHEALPAVHVAGTKGKGSTAAMVASVLSAAGYRTGVFTSPHLEQVEERLAVDGQACSATELAELVDRVSPVVEAMDREAAAGDPPEHGPTYFEVITAMAMLHFARRQVAAAVLEVGLGGRLDSTNVCRPLVSAITSISLDHTQQLGTTLESIAREKAGIVKPGVPVVSGVLDPAPRDVIRETCRQQGSRLIELGVNFDFDYHAPRNLESAPAMGSLDFRTLGMGGDRDYQGVPIALLGHHQAANAAVALAALAELAQAGWNISEEAIRAGLGGLAWPARVDVVARRPVVVIDSAHNSASVDALVRVLDESFSVRRRWLVFAASHEKDVRGMLSRLLGSFDDVILTRYLNNPRGVPPEELGALAAELTGGRYSVCQSPADAWQQVCALARPEDLVCVTGSFFLAAEVRHLLRVQPES